MSNALPIHVTKTAQENNIQSDKPDHWVDKKPSAFQNPWPSFKLNGAGDTFNLVSSMAFRSPAIPKDITNLVRKPTWGAGNNESSSTSAKDKITATWLGHACFLVELPVRGSGVSPLPSRGARILFDPVFSDRCSPSQWAGPARYTPPPCAIEDIPEIDAIVISHNHYDHLDTATIRSLMSRPRTPHVFAPLGNGPFFRCLNIAESHTHIMDWWETRRVEVDVLEDSKNSGDTKGTQKIAFDITCTPAQHFTGRGLLDRFKSLWASWAVEEVVAEEHASAVKGVKVFFGGDTGYRTVKDGQDEDAVPACPAFKEIGERFGGFDFAMIPIGAYLPRSFMSSIHCAPQDSVRLFKDIRAKRALGMHWGTWVLTTEAVREPPQRLAEECKKIGIEDGAFTVCDIGETMFF